ncbi:hypothetical protein J14TS2_16110 [Bacillus sp. J14TS2]|uniref:DUF3599 family protein n=1 Tax=Bacillus sp. J14TS2 TaxID=2807188 RepID=UPI001B28FAB7|nr:DUF3599 family protein [Bacillus sp. J14TS2]GIN71136.1 hypothetical protein J14TS2_16110 [Bacillus sp. J14TS2]
MSYENLLTHECDVYHLKSRPVEGGGFGVPTKDRQEEQHYDEDPDISEQNCYFTENTQTISQGEPNAIIIERQLVHFPISADIRINSKIVWEGIEYKSQKPRNIKNHHQEVILVRSESL